MTPQQQRLLEKAENNLQAANALSEKGFFDIAASRAYYAMFYIATAFLEGEGLSYSKHSGVIAAFGQTFARTRRVPVEFHRYLINAERVRLKADYNSDPNIAETDTELLLSRAKEMLDFAINNIDSLPPPSP